ncbi:MAG: PKD repeat protein [Chlorobi bacterium OLB5]|nr:MAG: PKD repeat protein [Chlorobi bacterium OLB5]
MYCTCPYYNCQPSINRVEDSVKIIIEENASLQIPDSSTYIFEGSETKLICKENSEIKLGKGSKLIFEDGARIIANGCKFTSYDSTDTWDGIYLSGIAYDTLKNCTFQNAVNGINITDNYDPFGSPGAVEISNCTFKNSTSTELLNYVYVNNSYNVLVKGCNAVKTGSAGFTAGIIAEYCPAGGIVICDNNINYVNTGISLLQSSEYIARNVITGYSNTGTGIYLDNSNGTIEYNTVNNFQKSVYGSYSSPYLLKNTLIDAYVTNIDLVNSSMPVMKPVISSSTLRWLGGNNNITGYPTNSGIRFADCYPLIDSGYNKIVVNGSDYLNGNFTFLYTEVPARINYWYDNPPNSSLFDISGGYADYSNSFDGTNLPATDGSELNSIGWGLYDSVFTKTMGDNPTPEDLFTQAYTEEMSNNYTDAITHYKEVVSSYKTSEYAPVALARIFNCLEKSRASISQFYAIQGYYTNIQNNSAYPNATRELSEDFKIKSKVKQFNIEEAINDYETIYQNNQNNAKGLHALLNKLSLQRMTQGDAPNSNMVNYTEHKLGILSLITGQDLKNTSSAINNQPSQFRLHQNYPNPFNPTTSIRYDIPQSAYVTIKVYDILGKEVFSYKEYKPAGSYEVKFDGSNLASGMYFYSLEANGYKDVKKMVLIK